METFDHLLLFFALLVVVSSHDVPDEVVDGSDPGCKVHDLACCFLWVGVFFRYDGQNKSSKLLFVLCHVLVPLEWYFWPSLHFGDLSMFVSFRISCDKFAH